jgi:UDP-N-acetylmuramoyl-tripeptide--D-alanyl-D-alanine ligase
MRLIRSSATSGWYGLDLDAAGRFGRMRFSARSAAEATGGRLEGPDVELRGASFDSRTLRPGQLFVPIVAERDGHDFIDDALAAGAPAYLTARAPRASATAVVVADTASALMDLGRWARTQAAERLGNRVIGITGSVGKTSVKDLTAAALRARWRTAANDRSYNNEQGLPVTLLDAADDAEALVLEMGMRGPGEIARLCEVGRPTIGIVTLVAAAHTERLGDVEGVAEAKAELVEALPAGGIAILNADDRRVAAMASRTAARALTFGTTAGADVLVRYLVLSDDARPRFRCATPWGEVEVALAVSGAHMAMNASAALAAALVCDVPLADAAGALGTATLSPWRMELCRSASGALVLNDAYNANPTSMRAALSTLASLPARRRVAIVGLMAELDDPEPAHRAIADEAERLGIELVPVGVELYGVRPVADPLAELGPVGEGDAVLVKGSRVAGLEAVAARLLSAQPRMSSA